MPPISVIDEGFKNQMWQLNGFGQTAFSGWFLATWLGEDKHVFLYVNIDLWCG